MTETFVENTPKRKILCLPFPVEKNLSQAQMKVRKGKKSRNAEIEARLKKEMKEALSSDSLQEDETLAVSTAPQTESKTLAASTVPQKRNVANTVSPNAKAFMENRWKR